MRSLMMPSRDIIRDTKAATAPRKNAGAMAFEKIRVSLSMSGTNSMLQLPHSTGQQRTCRQACPHTDCHRAAAVATALGFDRPLVRHQWHCELQHPREIVKWWTEAAALNVRVGSKCERLDTSKCCPLFARSPTWLGAGEHGSKGVLSSRVGPTGNGVRPRSATARRAAASGRRS